MPDPMPRVAVVEPRTGFVLWHRTRRGEPWQMVATVTTEREAWALVRGKGDWTALPVSKQL